MLVILRTAQRVLPNGSENRPSSIREIPERANCICDDYWRTRKESSSTSIASSPDWPTTIHAPCRST